MAAAEVYVQQLSSLGHGLPLWNPEPIHGEEINVADVGYLRDNGFARLFNVALPPSDPSHTRLGVPSDFETPLVIPNNFINKSERWFHNNEVLGTTDVRATEFGAGASADAVTVVGDVNYSCSSNSGALLHLKEGAARQTLYHTSPLIRNYVLANYSSWIAFANETHMLDLRADQLVFVTGCDKAPAWKVAAFLGQERGVGAALKGGLPSVAGLFGKISTKHTRRMHVESRHGPDRAGAHRTDQCMFVRGYKVKERPLLSPRVIKATADVFDDFKDEGPWKGKRPMETNTRPEITLERVDETSFLQDEQSSLHPVDVLLDYILATTDATIALAHDDDLVALGVRDYTKEGIHAILNTLSPLVTVSSRGVGMLSIEADTDQGRARIGEGSALPRSQQSPRLAQ